MNILEEIDGKPNHYYLKTEKVLEYSKLYFGCNSNGNGMEVVMDEDENFHWSARYLLGDYMAESSYTEEQVISNFTLALFEDLGYLQVKKACTGGLMRFGKNKGCDFLTDKCNVDKFENMRINFAPNFDDTRMEPTVLPARFPNLLVNGCTGISAGYATNMPPHNLGEIVDATIKRIDFPNCALDTIMSIVKGPDFPTGGIVEDLSGLRKAYETGRGKINVLCKYEFIREKGKDKIIVNEIPFDVNKALIVKKIDEIRLDKKIDGIAEVRDESDKDANIRIVIDLKPNANKELVMNYLLKNTDLQVSYNYNNVTIVNRRPRLLGILPILDAYIDHQKFVVRKSAEWDLAFAKKQCHITEGLVKAISILDDVIKTIRGSKNKTDAKNNLVEKYEFTEAQAEAIVMLQLYRLTNTDIVTLEEHLKELLSEIERLEGIINDEDKLNSEIKKDLRRIKKEYATPRKTEIRDTITEIKINKEELIPDEKTIVVLSRDGYLKRVSPKSYNENEPTGLKPGDTVLNLYNASTLDRFLIVTDLGNYLYLRVYDIPETKWKEMGKHISNIVTVSTDERVINSFIVNDNTKEANIITMTQNGMVKMTELKEYNVTRYNKAFMSIKLKGADRVVACTFENENVLLATKNGNYVLFKSNEIPVSGVKTSGVKGIALKDGDVVVAGTTFTSDDEYLVVFTNKKTAKRVKLSELGLTSRAKRGMALFKKTKTVTYELLNAFIADAKMLIDTVFDTEVTRIKATEIPIMDVDSTGSNVIKTKIDSVVLEPSLKDPDEDVGIILPKIDNDNTDDEFLEQFKL